MKYFETQTERKDLPLVVVPVVFDAMYDDLVKASSLLEDVARVRIYDDFVTDRDAVAQRFEGAQAAVNMGIHFDDELLSRISGSVKCLVFGGTGVTSYVDLARARDFGIEVRNIVHYGDASVAEHTLALMLDVARQVSTMDRSMKAGEWNTLECIDLHGKTLGVVGFGGIGKAVSAMAAAFGMRVRVWARPAHQDEIESQGYEFCDTLEEIFAGSDVVSLHVGFNESTTAMITSQHLQLLSPGSFFINTARAELIEPGALESRLARGDIRAGIDVYDQEPLPAASPLRAMSNVVLTPHAAWFSDAASENIAQFTFEDVRAYLRGDDLNLVN
jgi:phosphoglycerate dehydrogenase-like enzyme